jgi:hypothetical protein
MAGAIDLVSINGNQLSWGSCSFAVDGIPIIGVKGCKYADKRERVKSYGAGRAHAPRGRTRGKYTAEASGTFHKDTASSLRAYLAARGGGATYGDTEFTFGVQYFESDTGLVDVQLQRCVYSGTDATDEENPDPLFEEVVLDPMLIVRNGLTLFDADEGFAGILGAALGAAGAIANQLGIGF